MRGLIVPGSFVGAICSALAGGAIASSASVDLEMSGRLERRCVISLGTSVETQTGKKLAKPLVSRTLVSILCNFPGATLFDVLLPNGRPLSSQLLRTEINVMSQVTANGQSLLTFQLTANPLDLTSIWGNGAAAASITPN